MCESIQLVIQSADSLDLTVVIPTRNEAGNIATLVAELDRALGDSHAEILFVDDSSDDTPLRIAEAAEHTCRRVGILHRAPHERAGGLGSAVLAGLRRARTRWVVVMDGDLQHPPTLVPALTRLGEETDADVVVASRYVGAGSASGLGSALRSRVSSGATTAAKAVFPRRLRDCTDPMSGFFAVRVASLDTDSLHPSGFKILLEILARSPRLRVSEHPFVFQERHSGESKASWREGAVYLRKLLSLRAASLFAGHRRLLAATTFAAVGVSGIAINSAALWLLIELLGAPLLLAAALATQVSTAWNFALTNRFVFPGQKVRPAWLRFLGFAVINNATLLGRLPLLAWLVHRAGVGYLPANLITLIAAFAVRFILSDRYLFTRGKDMTSTCIRNDEDAAFAADRPGPDVGADPAAMRQGPVDVVVDLREVHIPAARRVDALPWRYDLHGILTIGSTVRLRELDCFAAECDGPFDLEVHPGRLNSGRGRARARVTQYAALPAVSYEEHLGRLGSDFFVDMTDNITVFAGPMLLRSPHVLYTNVVEALLRFALVARGYMLLHSACLELDGRGVMLSALTDTGKTGTILRLLRENPSRFLSDDMTILDPNGTALCYPKPLTISQHTLRAVNAGDLSAKEWRRLRLQSRLHSKEGRSVGARLGEMNMPIMSLNAVTQFVVPPPKYFVERLVPCERAVSTTVERLFIIERGEPRLADIDDDSLIDELIANTDDAYGFPPFRYFAPALVMGDEGYEELRARERGILASAVSGIHAQRVATPDFTWADCIPELARTPVPIVGSRPNMAAAEFG